MDDRGYVIAHRDLVEAHSDAPLQQTGSGGWGPSERKHITHMVRTTILLVFGIGGGGTS